MVFGHRLTRLYCLHKTSSIHKCNLTVYVGLRDDLGAQSSPMSCRVYVSAGAVIRSLESPIKHTLTQQLSVLILYHVDEIRIDVLNIKNSQKYKLVYAVLVSTATVYTQRRLTEPRPTGTHLYATSSY